MKKKAAYCEYFRTQLGLGLQNRSVATTASPASSPWDLALAIIVTLQLADIHIQLYRKNAALLKPIMDGVAGGRTGAGLTGNLPARRSRSSRARRRYVGRNSLGTTGHIDACLDLSRSKLASHTSDGATTRDYRAFPKLIHNLVP